MALSRLDHVIVEVPDIRAGMDRLHLEEGFAEAWPIGPFWTGARTAGVAMGGLNLELLQPTDRTVPHPMGTTLVFEPDSLEAVEASAAAAGIATERRTKRERDPALLLLRGFSEEDAAREQEICTNLHFASTPLPAFACQYAPFLRRHLDPEHYEEPYGPVVRVGVRLPDPDALAAWLKALDYRGAVELALEAGPTAEVAFIEMENACLDLPTLVLHV